MGMVENFLSEAEVNEILTDFMSRPRNNEPTNDYVNGGDTLNLTETFYNLPTTLKFIERFEAYLKPIYGSDIKFENTYTRMYKNGSFLRTHTDRSGLDVTISLGLKRDVPWSLNVSPKPLSSDWNNSASYDKSAWMKEFTAYDLYPGDFCHCFGRKNPHWRTTLQCNANQNNIYTFFHWRYDGV